MYPLRKKRLTIHRHRESPSFTKLWVNEQLLKQALLNLLLNAIHASLPDGHIEIHCRRKSPSGNGYGRRRPCGWGDPQYPGRRVRDV